MSLPLGRDGTRSGTRDRILEMKNKELGQIKRAVLLPVDVNVLSTVGPRSVEFPRWTGQARRMTLGDALVLIAYSFDDVEVVI